jgi:hypothetical protein
MLSRDTEQTASVMSCAFDRCYPSPVLLSAGCRLRVHSAGFSYKRQPEPSFSLTSMYLAAVLASLAFGWAALLVWRRSQTQVQLPLPPGPNPLPILGNLFDIPTSKEWLTYHEWHARYGALIANQVGIILIPRSHRRRCIRRGARPTHHRSWFDASSNRSHGAALRHLLRPHPACNASRPVRSHTRGSSSS